MPTKIKEWRFFKSSDGRQIRSHVGGSLVLLDGSQVGGYTMADVLALVDNGHFHEVPAKEVPDGVE